MLLRTRCYPGGPGVSVPQFNWDWPVQACIFGPTLFATSTFPRQPEGADRHALVTAPHSHAP
jgi:hypothetical protein